MTAFNEIIFANHEELMQYFFKLKNDKIAIDDRLAYAARTLGLRTAQIVCAFGSRRRRQQVDR